MKKQLRLSSQPISMTGEMKVQEKKKTLESSFFERLKEELKKYEYVTSNQYFKNNFDTEKMKTFSRAWDMYRKLKKKAHEVVQSGFEMYKHCQKKENDSSLEAVINTYNVIKDKETKQEKQESISKVIPPVTQSLKDESLTVDQQQQEILDHKQINEIYIILFFGLQLRSLCDWLYTNLNPQNLDTSNEEQLLRQQKHEYFNETIPSFIKKTKQKIYYQDLAKQDKKLVDKISQGYDPKAN